MIESLVEGYFLITVDGLIFEVKGIIHPKDRVIAYVRYVPGFDSNYNENYRKIYDLRERDNYLRKKFPSYLWFSEVDGRLLQAVPHKNIKQVLDPVEGMNQIRKDSSELSIATVKLVDLLIEYTGIDRQCVGVTGSQLTGLASKTSDIDLVIFGESASRKFYSGLNEFYDEIPGIDRYQGNLLEEHVHFRWEKLDKFKDILCKIETQKILQGLFQTKQFFIRLVKSSQDISESYGELVTESLGITKMQCTILDDSDSIFSPCMYQVKSDEFPEITQVISYRGRFTEHVSQGETVKARGKLEHVIKTDTHEEYYRLILGESSLDYLIPQ